MRRLALLLFFAASPAWAQPPPSPEPPIAAPDIHMPDIQAPSPPPTPAPGTVPVLPARVIYAITSAKPFFVLASPAGLVSVTWEAGPIVVKANFVEAPDKYVSRKFTDHYVCFVEAVGTGRVEIIAVPSGVTKESDIIRRLVDCGGAPQPPPSPVPPGPIPPTPDAFQAALQAAYALEPAADKANQVKVLAGFYRAAALTTVRNPALATLGDLQDTLKLAVKQIGLPAGALSRLVPVIAADEVRALGTTPSTPLSQATRDAAASEFVRVAAALEITGGVH